LLQFSEVADLEEQRVCYKCKETVSETYRTLTQAFYDDTMSRVQTLVFIVHVTKLQLVVSNVQVLYQ